MTGLRWCLWGQHLCCCRAVGGLQRAPWRSSWGLSPGRRRRCQTADFVWVFAWGGAASLVLDPPAKCSEAAGCFQQLSLRASAEEGSPWFPFSRRGDSCQALFFLPCWPFDKTRGGAKVDLQFRVRDAELILVLILFINYCIISCTNNCTLLLFSAPPRSLLCELFVRIVLFGKPLWCRNWTSKWGADSRAIRHHALKFSLNKSLIILCYSNVEETRADSVSVSVQLDTALANTW